MDFVAEHDKKVAKFIERVDTQQGEKKIKQTAEAKVRKAMD